ncbi:MAG TPA: hypothetical protein VMD91_09915 [Candidatus Sulfotelmatobacter sp.]|nr:hypothetical protein [Candidatus Sulfotelmatobacter sp.]
MTPLRVAALLAIVAALGCVAEPAAPPERPAADPAASADATRALGGKTSLRFHVARAWYLDAHAEEFDAMREFRAAIAAGEAMPPARVDGYARLPLSVRLYRAGDVAGARAQWQISLGDAVAYDEGEPATQAPCPPAQVLAARAAGKRSDVERTRDAWLTVLDLDEHGRVAPWRAEALRALLRLTADRADAANSVRSS